jgi:hypothetical protein
MKTLALSSPHARGRDVSDAQSKLQAAGFLAEQPDGEFGTLTMQACRRAHYWLGFDGSLQYAPTYGDRLDALLDDFLDDGKLAAPYGARRAARVAAGKRASSSVGGRALAKAAGELGYKESPAGSNHQKFGVWYGVDRQPWCAMFVSWAYVVGAKSRAFIRGSRYAYVPYIVADAGAGRNYLSLTSDPRPGDVVCFDWEGNGVADHVGLFEKWTTKGRTFQTVEGNTSVGNNSNGGQVMRRRRSPDQLAEYHGIRAFVRVGK